MRGPLVLEPDEMSEGALVEAAKKAAMERDGASGVVLAGRCPSCGSLTVCIERDRKIVACGACGVLVRMACLPRVN